MSVQNMSSIFSGADFSFNTAIVRQSCLSLLLVQNLDLPLNICLNVREFKNGFKIALSLLD